MRLLINKELIEVITASDYMPYSFTCMEEFFRGIRVQLTAYAVSCVITYTETTCEIKVGEQKCDLVEADMTKVMGYLSEVFTYEATYRHRGADVEMCLAID